MGELELVFSETCPYCRGAARAVSLVDVGDRVDLTPIESERGRTLVEGHHNEFVHTPHLFTMNRVYYGIGPTLRGLVTELPREYWP